MVQTTTQSHEDLSKRTDNTVMSEGNTVYTSGTVISKDGTVIGYRQIGSGPAIVLVQGAMGTVANYDELARNLAKDFTVYLPERRGRGLSPREFAPDHFIQRDVEDLESILLLSDAHLVFGLSSGAVIVLEAARVLTSIRKVALYEPPLYLRGMPTDMVARFDNEVRRGKLAAALVTASRIVCLGPPLLNVLPRPFLELGTAILLRGDDQKNAAKYARMRELVPAMRFDFKVVSEMSGKIETFASVKADVLLLGGSRSPKYLKKALDALEQIVTTVRRVEFEDLDHSAAWNHDRGGTPEVVGESLRGFFKE